MVQQWNWQSGATIAPGPITSTGERHFDRLHLRAVSHQIMALVTALTSPPVRMCMLGGGGMAIPMALLSFSGEMMVSVEEIHVVELHQVATWMNHFEVKGFDLNESDDEIPLNCHSKICMHLNLFKIERMQSKWRLHKNWNTHDTCNTCYMNLHSTYMMHTFHECRYIVIYTCIYIYICFILYYYMYTHI